ncbi:endoplasmic reticulum vesicle transporter-domain-containing protein [Paraphysoderma sedebokerense]|nr:endoplasmic reticulum vesicle transporter-domain-containing protein [Paraphysoderma sedebokerense]
MTQNGSFLKRFDAYAKTLDDFRIRTSSGGLVTIASAILIAVLITSEFVDWRTPEMKPQLLVDTSRKDQMSIYFNVTFPSVPCFLLSLDVMDVSGEHQNDIAHDIYKVRIDKSGKPVVIAPEKVLNGTSSKACGDCFGGVPPPSGCCNTCEDVRVAYQKKGWSLNKPEEIEQCVREGWVTLMKEQAEEGCNVHGHLEVNKVAGNFHFAPGRSFQQAHMHIHDMNYYANRQFDFSHTIHYLSFGKMVQGMVNPLDDFVLDLPKDKSHSVQNFIKVVGTEFYFLNGTSLQTNQYSVTEYRKDVTGGGGFGHLALPGVFFNFDISPMLVIYREYRKSFVHFITDVCAIVGGIFTVAGLIDSGIYQSSKVLKQKMELGKLN